MQETFGESAGAITSVRNMVTASDLMAQGNATNQAAYEATGLNGLPCMKFDGAGDHMLSTEAAPMSVLGNVAAELTFIYVADIVTPNRSSAVFGAGNSGVSNSRFFSIGTSTVNGGQHIYNTEGDASGINRAARTVTAVAGPQVVAWVSIGANVSCYVNGKQLGMTSFTLFSEAVTVNRFALGCRPDSAPDTFYDGRLGCLLLFGRALPKADMLGLSTAMMARWRVRT
jgi:hypothetical protein